MQKLSEQNNQLHQKEEEAKQKEAELKDAIKKKSEQTMVQQRLQRQKDSQFQQQLQELLISDQMTTVFSKYDKFLERMFEFYSKQAKVDISKIQSKEDHLALQEFNKFGYQTKVVPVLIGSEELI